MAIQTPRRIFHMEDANLIQKSNILYGYFLQDQALFIEEDSTFAPPFAENYRALIDECKNFPTDNQTVAQQTAKTQDVNKYMEDSKEESKKLERIVLKKNSKDSAVYKEFAFRHDLDRISQPEMMSYMNQLYLTAKKYKVMLIENGYTEEKIENLKTVDGNLTTSDTDQEGAKGNRHQSTQDRITKFNQLYKMDKDVSEVGQRINKKDPVKKAQYEFIDRPTNENNDDNQTPPAPPTPPVQ